MNSALLSAVGPVIQVHRSNQMLLVFVLIEENCFMCLPEKEISATGDVPN